jgi:hypothetical protein
MAIESPWSMPRTGSGGGDGGPRRYETVENKEEGRCVEQLKGEGEEAWLTR